MKKLSSICLALAVLCEVANYASFYWMGLSGESEWPFLIPMISGLIQILLILLILVAWIISLFQKRERLWTTAIVLGCVALIGCVKVLPYDAIRVYGIRNQVMHEYSLDDLRHFAQEVHQGIVFKSGTPGGWINHGDTTDLTESEKVVYGNLREKYPFLRWMSHGEVDGGASISSPDNGAVSVFWGSALPGHWGFCVSADGKNNDPGIDSTGHMRALQVSDDIYFFSGE